MSSYFSGRFQSSIQKHQGFSMMELVVVLFLMVMFQLCVGRGFLRIQSLRYQVDSQRQALSVLKEFVQRSRINQSHSHEYFDRLSSFKNLSIHQLDAEKTQECSLRFCSSQALLVHDIHWLYRSLARIDASLQISKQSCFQESADCIVLISKNQAIQFQPVFLPINFSHRSQNFVIDDLTLSHMSAGGLAYDARSFP